MHGSTYPGLEKEQDSPNTAVRPQRLCWSVQPMTAASPLAGRQAKPGTSSRPGPSSKGVLQPSSTSRGLFGGGPHAPSSPSAWTDAGAAEPTVSTLQPADSGFTVEGPAPKRLRLASSWVLTGGGAANSDSDGEEAVVSRKRPTPEKGPHAGPTSAAAAEVAAAAAPKRVRVAAQHPPPTWAASLHSGAIDGARTAAAPPLAAQAPRQEQQGPKVLPAAADADDADNEWSEGSDMEDEEDDAAAYAEWHPFPLPHPLDVEE